MWILQLAWKNMWRNRNRTFITMASVFFAVILTIFTSTLKTGIFDNLVKNMVSFYSGYIQVHKNGYWEEQLLDNSFEQTNIIENKLGKSPHVIIASPRLESFALASAGNLTKGCWVVGMDPMNENKITALQNKLIEGTYLSNFNNGVMVAEGLLKRLNLKMNDTVILIGQGYHGTTAAGKYAIQGVLKFGSPDLNDKTLYMKLETAQELFGAPKMLTAFVLSIDNTKKITTISQELKKRLGEQFEVMNWEEMMPDIAQHIHADAKNMYYIQSVLYLLICFGIFGTLLMMMAERKFEIGMLLAIGMDKKWLALMLFTETILLVLLGCFFGIVTSIPIVWYFKLYPLRFSGATAEIYERFGFEAIFPTSTDPSIFLWQGIIVCTIGFILALYPVFKIIRMNAVEAMRK